MTNNENNRTIGQYLEANNMTMKDLASSKNLSIGELMDLMNMDYDRNDPYFMQKFQLKVYQYAKQNGMAKIVPKLEENMVTNPETIGLSKNSHVLDGMEQAIEVINKTYSMSDNLENTQSRTR